MIQLTIIRIEGYGPWTLTLGYDREAQLQMLQARIYHDVQRLFHEKDCLVYFNRFDEYFAITNGVTVAQHAEIAHALAILYNDLKMSMAIGAGKTALEASMSAYNARKENRLADEKARIFGSAAASGETSAQIMHIDVDSSTKLTGRLSPYEVTALVMKLYGRLAEEFLKLDALTFFLGGDNFMVISNGVTGAQADEVIKKVTAGLDVKFNCGIGIGKNGRRAAEAATKALDTIRDMRDEGKIQTIYEIRC
ncbi:GTP cyclohydrolase IIa [Nitrososphaera viennensis]|uniref:GTP cyclohydrolase III n=2 Tax=Nitrososphaera viennensis TaxID=1034015 RepID=A0A060HMU3_9ARCH|nr:GTP cyclohydrolase IIa [Nitrososphaera viennensis]AIC16450.1 GTP cyclohydrolase III [Nitrososphaera viennensis EN76]UVS68384.1 GTP cyclohydrolase IIa [Nitrososphaera viennensis]